MASITLSPEQIRSAPPEVRRWIEQEVARSLGLAVGEPEAEHAPQHLVGCSVNEAQAILTQIPTLLAVVLVFFELGGKGSAAGNGVRAVLIGDIMSHALLHMPGQVVECLDVINEALRRTCGDANATLYALDRSGHCLIAETTAQSILRLWRSIIAAKALGSGGQQAGQALQSTTDGDGAGVYAAGLPETVSVGRIAPGAQVG